MSMSVSLAALAGQAEREPGAGHDRRHVGDAVPADIERAKSECNRIGREVESAYGARRGEPTLA